MTRKDPSTEITVDRVGPGGGVASDSAFGVALVTLWQRSAEAGAPVGFAAPVVRSDVAARAAGLVDEIRTGRVLAVAANRSHRMVAAGLLRPGRGTSRHTGHLELLLVDPDHTGDGLGTRVLGQLLDMGRAVGIVRADVQVPAGSGLETFFARFGFVVWGRRPGWIRSGPGEDRDELLLGADL